MLQNDFWKFTKLYKVYIQYVLAAVSPHISPMSSTYFHKFCVCLSCFAISASFVYIYTSNSLHACFLFIVARSADVHSLLLPLYEFVAFTAFPASSSKGIYEKFCWIIFWPKIMGISSHKAKKNSKI